MIEGFAKFTAAQNIDIQTFKKYKNRTVFSKFIYRNQKSVGYILNCFIWNIHEERCCDFRKISVVYSVKSANENFIPSVFP